MEELKIVYIDPRELTPYEGNARKHGVEDIGEIVRSIETDGFNDPIGVWGENNLIVEGHGRQLAALQLGLESVPCIRLDHLTDAQRRDYAIRHNRTAELSGWDFEALEKELETLEDEGFDFDGLKFAFDGIGSDAYVDDFFDRGNEAKEKPEVIGVKVVCGSQEQAQEVFDLLTDNGYNPEML